MARQRSTMDDTSTETTMPAPEPAPEPAAEVKIPGWPAKRYHPVHGAKEMKDPNEAALAGPDWRFETAADADAARTETEAVQACFATSMKKHKAHEEAGEKVAFNSAQAQESLDKGVPEPL